MNGLSDLIEGNIMRELKTQDETMYSLWDMYFSFNCVASEKIKEDVFIQCDKNVTRDKECHFIMITCLGAK